LIMLGLFAAPDELKGFAQTDINVQQPQGTEGGAEIGLVPKVLKLDFMAGKESGEMVQCP